MSDPGPDRVGEVEAPGEVASKVFDKLAAQDAERRRGAERRKEEARSPQSSPFTFLLPHSPSNGDLRPSPLYGKCLFARFGFLSHGLSLLNHP